MKVLLAGAFGNLGYEILKSLVKENHEVIAADLKERDTELKGKYTFKEIDATKPETLTGICDNVDVVITTMGLTGASTVVNSYDIDYQGNLNLLNEAKKLSNPSLRAAIICSRVNILISASTPVHLSSSATLLIIFIMVCSTSSLFMSSRCCTTNSRIKPTSASSSGLCSA